MLSVSFQKSRRQAIMSIVFGVSFVAIPILLAACGSSTGSATPTSNALPCSTQANTGAPTPTPYPPTASLTAPKDLITAGTLKVGSDTTYPPQEFIDTATGNAIGFDVDLITAMAQKLGLKAKVVTANFDTKPMALPVAVSINSCG